MGRVGAVGLVWFDNPSEEIDPSIFYSCSCIVYIFILPYRVVVVLETGGEVDRLYEKEKKKERPLLFLHGIFF